MFGLVLKLLLIGSAELIRKNTRFALLAVKSTKQSASLTISTFSVARS